MATKTSSIKLQDPGQLVEETLVPIKWWAAVGAFFCAVQLYSYSRWAFFSSNFVKNSTGPGEIPLSFRIATHAMEIVMMGLMVWGNYRYVYKPLRTRRGLTPLGYMWLAGFTGYWLNWGASYAVPLGNNSSVAWFNRGSWYNFIPGWNSLNGHKVAELSSFAFPIVVIWFALGGMAMASAMRIVKARWPSVSNSRLVLMALGGAFILDVVVETTLLRFGTYVIGGVAGPTLFRGHYYQFPLWEALLVSGIWGACGFLLYFTDDRGNTWVDRGLDRLKLSARKVGVVRFFAYAAFVNVLMVLYCLVWVTLTVTPNFHWVNDVIKRPYLVGGICGPGTDVACPAKGMPMQRVGGIRIDPDGNIWDHGQIIGKMKLDYSN